MIINKNSWHYRLWSWTYTNSLEDKYPPSKTNLCSYVQRIVGIPLFYLLLFSFIITIVLGILVGIGIVEYEAWSIHPYRSLVGHLVIALLIGIVIGSVFWRETSNPTLVVMREYVSAKKQGICPLIEFNENE